MSGPTGFSHLLNGPEEEKADSQRNAIIPSSSASRRASISSSTNGHKYSSSQGSESSFNSSTPQLQTPSHSRNASQSTTASQSRNPPTPPSAHSLTGSFPAHLYYDNCNKMADMADNQASRPTTPDGEDHPQSYPQSHPQSHPQNHPQNHPQHHASQFASNQDAIDLTTESPSNAAMPLISRTADVAVAPATGAVPTASRFTFPSPK